MPIAHRDDSMCPRGVRHQRGRLRLARRVTGEVDAQQGGRDGRAIGRRGERGLGGDDKRGGSDHGESSDPHPDRPICKETFQ